MFKIVVSSILIFAIALSAQISVSNQLEFSNWKEYNRNILENWTDIGYQQDIFSFGFRYEINQPPDPFIFERDSLLQKEELTFKYVEIYKNDFTITLGNYYAMFGRGLVLRTYEDRNLRVDTNLEGAKINYFSDFGEFTALGGRMRDKYNRRDDRLYGFDAAFDILGVHIGGSFVRNQRTDSDFKDLKAVRLNSFFSDFEIYAELAQPGWNDKLSAYYSVSYFGDFMTLVGEYKDYNQLAFFNRYQTEYNAPPALTREHTYTLLNRHPHVLNTADERGYQFETILQASQNLEFLLNYSFTETHNSQRTFEEYYAQTHMDYTENIRAEAALGWNFDFSTGTENITPILMTEYEWSGVNEIHLELQHQHVKNTSDKSEFDDELIVLEYSRSPYGTLSLVGEYSNEADLNTSLEDTKYWMYAQAILNINEANQLTVLYGSRRAGFVCAGGVCRFEPEFEGLELKLLSRF